MLDPKVSDYHKILRKVQCQDSPSHAIPPVAYIPASKDPPLLASIQPEPRLSLAEFNPLGVTGQETADTDQTTTVHKPRRLHYIPRFILKLFIPERASGGYWSRRRKTGSFKELINRYSLKSPTPSKLRMLEIENSYCERDLYVDQNFQNPYQLENELGKLESAASVPIVKLVDTLKKGEIPNTYKMTRRNLNLLHKFLFVMYYRKPSVGNLYRLPDTEPPDNECLQHHTKNSGSWLKQLHYILVTPHWEIVEHGRKSERKKAELYLKYPHLKWSEPSKSLGLLEEVCMEEEYMKEADGCFLAIWRAAEGEEFIISNESFGILEGSESSWGPIHRFYVISPQVALVTCSVGLDQSYNCKAEIKARCKHSVLRGVKHKRPKITHETEPPEFGTEEERLDFESKSHTRERDTIEFEISTLTAEETRTMNAIILETTPDDGMITYSSEKALQKTLDSYKENLNFKEQSRYEPLRELLRGEVVMSGESGCNGGGGGSGVGGRGEEGKEQWDDNPHASVNVLPPKPEQQLQLQENQFQGFENIPYLDQAISGGINAYHPVGPASLEKVKEMYMNMLLALALSNLYRYTVKQLLVSCIIATIIFQFYQRTHRDG